MDVLMGVDPQAADGEVGLLVAVRQNRKLSAADLDGAWIPHGVVINTKTYPIDLDRTGTNPTPVNIGDWELVNLTETRSFSGHDRWDFTDIVRRQIARQDPGGWVRTSGVTSTRTEQATLQLESDGRYEVLSATYGNAGRVGAFPPGERFSFGLFDPAGFRSVFGIEFFVKLPPER
jgi:hypothetical protein